jgi:hypothetical protein
VTRRRNKLNNSRPKYNDRSSIEQNWAGSLVIVCLIFSFRRSSSVTIILVLIMEGLNQGDDIASIVYAVGSNETEFRPGDRVAGFHGVAKPAGGYAEYALTASHMTFHIPSTTSFDEAATVPLTAMTAAVLLYSLP